jgi:hypothetical protein
MGYCFVYQTAMTTLCARGETQNTTADNIGTKLTKMITLELLPAHMCALLPILLKCNGSTMSLKVFAMPNRSSLDKLSKFHRKSYNTCCASAFATLLSSPMTLY